jgi:hypothetical protein
MKYADYVTSKRGQIIFRFLSNLSDHYNKNTFWIKSQYILYIKKFKNIPEAYLIKSFQDYLMNELEWLPTVKKVAEYLHSRHDFKTHWHSVPLDQTYCEHCRTDDDGKEGGFREVYFYGYRQSLQKKAEAHYKGACTCDLAAKSQHRSYLEVMDWMRAQDEFAEIHCSFYDATSDRIVPAQEQSHHHWQKKIDAGIIRIDENDQIAACWDHPMWGSVFGAMMCKRYGFDMPPEVEARYQATRDRLRTDGVKFKHGNNRRMRQKIGEDTSGNYAPPMSLAEAMGAAKR